MAVALVVLDSALLVYTLAYYRLAVVACLVGLVGVGMVAFSMDFLVILVGYCFQGTDNFALAPQRGIIQRNRRQVNTTKGKRHKPT